MDQSFFSEHPIPTLNLKAKEKEILVKQFLADIEFEDSALWYDEIMARYPEPRDKAIERVRLLLNDFKEQYHKPVDKKIAHLVVSHGVIVEKFCRLDHEIELPWVDFCAISAYEMKGREIKVLFDGSTEHVISK